MLRGVLNNEDIKGHILSGSLWGLTASGLFKKARPARPQPFLRAERTGTTWARKNGENAAGGFFQQTLRHGTDERLICHDLADESRTQLHWRRNGGNLNRYEGGSVWINVLFSPFPAPREINTPPALVRQKACWCQPAQTFIALLNKPTSASNPN